MTSFQRRYENHLGISVSADWRQPFCAHGSPITLSKHVVPQTIRYTYLHRKCAVQLSVKLFVLHLFKTWYFYKTFYLYCSMWVFNPRGVRALVTILKGTNFVYFFKFSINYFVFGFEIKYFKVVIWWHNLRCIVLFNSLVEYACFVVFSHFHLYK